MRRNRWEYDGNRFPPTPGMPGTYDAPLTPTGVAREKRRSTGPWEARTGPEKIEPRQYLLYIFIMYMGVDLNSFIWDPSFLAKKTTLLRVIPTMTFQSFALMPQ